MNGFKNKKQQQFLNSRAQSGIETSNLAERCKFNFSYFDDSQEAGQSFDDWGQSDGMTSLASLLDKIKSYTKEPLSYWQNQRVGGGGLKVLEYYGAFPKKSHFRHPTYIPHDVIWSRFRLGNKVRLIGFVIPEDLSGQEYIAKNTKKYPYDSNTFYVVFLDKDHGFYRTEIS